MNTQQSENAAWTVTDLLLLLLLLQSELLPLLLLLLLLAALMMLRSLNMGCGALLHPFPISVSSSSSSELLVVVVPKVHRRWGFQAQALVRDLKTATTTAATTTGLLKPMLVPKVHRRWGFQAQARDLNTPTTTGLLGQQALLKERLASGEQLYGAFSMSFSPIMAEILGWAQYDFVVVDMEHGPGGTMAALPVLQVLASTGTPAILRLPVNDPVWAKKALDLGPAGIMFPMIENADAARNAVRACQYPPKGIRGAAFPIVRAARYGMDSSYLDRCEAGELLIMCQVESVEAVKNIPEIAAVEGVDCIQMGPLDLRADMGLLQFPTDSSPSNLLREAEEMVKSTGVYLCGFATTDDSPSALMELGYHMVSGAIDVVLLRNAAVADVQHQKKKMKKKKLDPEFLKIL